MRALFAGFVFATLSMSVAALENALKDHVSPYLALHADDPVAWQEWDSQAQSIAQSENKIMFVSSGYFSCHWCHVMQEESFKDPEVAQLLNEFFVPVKVDRELNTVLDKRLIKFVEATKGTAGWPLSVFITPQGVPLYGAVYLPKDKFKSLLFNLKEQWKDNQPKLEVIAKTTLAGIAEPNVENYLAFTEANVNQALDDLVSIALKEADKKHGGFGQLQKFPMSVQLLNLIEVQSLKSNQELGDFLRLTLDQIALKGLNDHINDGFYRYAVDPRWNIPHFEKMAYDNLMLARVYLRAYQVFDDPYYLQVATRTLAFIQSSLLDSSSEAVISSLSALDESGREGGAYVYPLSKIQNTLSEEDYAFFKEEYEVDNAFGTDSSTANVHLIRKNKATNTDNQKRTDLNNRLRAILADKQVPRDDKILASINGLAIETWVEAYKITGNEIYLNHAKTTASFIAQHLWAKDEMYRSVAQGKGIGEASLEDYAYTASGLFALANELDNDILFGLSMSVIRQAWARYYVPSKGWDVRTDDWFKFNTLKPELSDGVTPSASAVLNATTIQLALKYNHRELGEQAKEAVARGVDVAADDPYFHSSYLLLALQLFKG